MKDEERAAFEIELKKCVEGEVRFDRLTRQLYSTDASDFKKLPCGVVIPRHINDVQVAVEIAVRHGISVIPRGGGSSVSGQTIGTGLIIDHSKYINSIVEINRAEQWVQVESGLVLDRLNATLVSDGLMIGPDPSSSAVATLGGMVGNNSTGAHSFVYGMMADHLIEVEAILMDGSTVIFNGKTEAEVQALAAEESLEGRLYREIPQLLDRYADCIDEGYPKTWRNVAGYNVNRLLAEREKSGLLNLAHLLCGSEGSLALITKVKLNVVKRPVAVRLALLHFPSLQEALEAVPSLLQYRVAAVELMAKPTLQLAHDHPVIGPRLQKFVEGIPGAILIVEFNGESEAELAEEAGRLESSLRQDGYQERISHCTTPEEIGQVWHIRKSVFGLIVSKPGDDKPVWIIDDGTVPVTEMTRYTEEVVAVGHRFGIDITFDAHASAGCLHMGLDLNLKTSDGLRKLEALTREIMAVAIKYNGTTTGEHGEGLARSFFNEQLYGKELHGLFCKIKNLFDPQSLLNPHKVIDGIEPWDTEWLKITPDYTTPYAPKRTFLDFSQYGGLAGLVEMCNGQGVCRSQVSGTMCPSYKFTRDEKDTTRGRANMLRAAMTGELGEEGLCAEEVYKALDLCLACKACRNECSTRVDMAKLKYEYLAQYQQKNGVPLRSRMIGSLEHSSRLASTMPGLANALFSSPLFRTLLEKTVGIDRRREMPRIAKKSFKKVCGDVYHAVPAEKKSVILWDDCYIRYNNPEMGKAAIRILEALGYTVICLQDKKCCGRPMISKGLLKEATENAHYNVDRLLPYVRKGIPIIGVEPSCITCFRDEYPDLLRSDAAREVAEQSCFFEEFVTRKAHKEILQGLFPQNMPPRKILLHTHCYQKSLGTADRVYEMLSLIPHTEVQDSGAGCCGMAGAFGYEKEHYEVSMGIGEMVLFPMVRAADKDTAIVASGTSCREQIRGGTSREARHPVEVLADALGQRN